MTELPTGWAWSTIGELSPYIQRGKSPKYADHSELPVVNQKCIRWTHLETQHLKFIHPEQFNAWDAARRIQPGDVLWNSTGTGTVGRAYLVQERDWRTSIFAAVAAAAEAARQTQSAMAVVVVVVQAGRGYG